MLVHSQAVEFLRDRSFAILTGKNTVREASKGATLLFVEDDLDCLAQYVKSIPDLASDIFWAFDLDVARKAFDELRDTLRAIAFDYNLGGENSLELIHHVKASGFRGLMIACSSMANARQEQLLAGCNAEATDKRDVGYLIRRLLLEAPANQEMH